MSSIRLLSKGQGIAHLPAQVNEPASCLYVGLGRPLQRCIVLADYGQTCFVLISGRRKSWLYACGLGTTSQQLIRVSNWHQFQFCGPQGVSGETKAEGLGPTNLPLLHMPVSQRISFSGPDVFGGKGQIPGDGVHPTEDNGDLRLDSVVGLEC